MKLTQIPATTLPVFSTFGRFRIPKQINVQSRDGDVSMLEALPSQGFAIVGSRLPQRRSIELLTEVMGDLKNSGLIIVSGFARGIDSKAHELAIESGLRTIAILGCGIARDYPKENSRLRSEIIESGGLVISQFDEHAEPLAQNFYNRNGTIAGFSKAVWVVEAAEVSGTLNTAKWASDLNRDLYATSCFPTDPHYQGNVKLLSQKDPIRYPVAQSLFNAESLAATWSELGDARLGQGRLPFSATPKSELQRWVLELQSLAGECHVQALMDLASAKGYTLGNFYHLFEAEVDSGKLVEDSTGRVQLGI
jgi:DNA protecting protein DprA